MVQLQRIVLPTFLQQFLKGTFLFQLNNDACAQSEVHEIEEKKKNLHKA